MTEEVQGDAGVEGGGLLDGPGDVAELVSPRGHPLRLGPRGGLSKACKRDR